MSETDRTIHLFKEVNAANFWAVWILCRISSRGVWIFRSTLNPKREQQLLDMGARKVDFATSDDIDMDYVYGDFKGIAKRVRRRTRHAGISDHLTGRLNKVVDAQRKLEAIRLGIIVTECRDIQKIICWAESMASVDRVRVIDGLSYLEYLFIKESRSCVVAGRMNTLFGLLAKTKIAGHWLCTAVGVCRSGSSSDPQEPGSDDASIWGLRRLEEAEITPVVYFPHMTIAYANLFLKDQFYSHQPDSVLYPGNILHVEHVKLSNTRFLDRVNAFYEQRGVTTVALPEEPRSARIRRFVRLVLELARDQRHPAWWLGKYSSYYLVAKRIVNYDFYCRLLCRFGNASVALIGYEILFPKELYLALETTGIKTVAVQERLFASSFYDDFPFFVDYYFVAGEAVARLLRERREIVANEVIPVGLVRSDLVERHIGQAGKDMVLCFDFVSWESEQKSRLDPMMNWPANANFYRDILALAAHHPVTEFVIRSRTLEWTELEFFSELVAQIERSPNVSISDDYSSYYVQYRLAAEARVVIAKHSSIAEECLARRVPVIIHDYTHNVRRFASSICDYSVAKLFAHDLPQLQGKLEAALAGDWLSAQEWHQIQGFVGGGDGVGTKARLVERLENICGAVDALHRRTTPG